MSITYKTIRRRTGKNLIISILILNVCVLFCLYGVPNIDCEPYFNDNTPPKTSFSKEEFEPIIDEEKQGLGKIIVTDLKFEDGAQTIDKEGLYYSGLHGHILDDFAYEALNISYISTTFNSTVIPARIDNLNQSYLDREIITIRINETLSVQYNISKETLPPYESPEGYIVYYPSLTPARLIDAFVKENGTSVFKRVHESNYSIDALNFLVFDYENYFLGKTKNNFTISMIWEYNISVIDWELKQDNTPLYLEEEEETVSPKFFYNFKIFSEKINKTTPEPDKDLIIPAEILELNIKVTPADRDLLYNHELKVNDIKKTGNIEPDNSINATLHANNSIFQLSFNADFTIEFLDSLENTWAIDRLVEKRNIRERIYFPHLISGPEHFYIKNLVIFERTITFTQVALNSSLFERSVAYFDANVSWFEEYQNSLVFTKNATKKRGLEIFLPYMITGEVCPFTIKYSTSADLRCVITDNINMPLQGIQVKILFYDAEFGTYISKDQLQPMAPAITDGNGEILIENVPDGNYTLEIYQNNKVVYETVVSSYKDINYVLSTIPHFPLWILIFGTFISVLFLIGLIDYLLNKRKR